MRKATVGAVGLIMLVAVAGFSAYAVAAPKGHARRAFSATFVGAEISSNGGSSEEVLKVVSRLDGTCAAIAENSLAGTSFPVHGTETTTIYCADGVWETKLNFVLNAPDASGILTYTGSGKCVGGTGVHKQEKCTYTFTGMFNEKTKVDKAKLTGTDKR